MKRNYPLFKLSVLLIFTILLLNNFYVFGQYQNRTEGNTSPLSVTNYTDNGAASNSAYYMYAIVNGAERQAYLQIPLQIPAGRSTTCNFARQNEDTILR